MYAVGTARCADIDVPGSRATPRPALTPRSSARDTLSAVNSGALNANVLHLRLRFRRSRDVDGQHAVLEGGVGGIDVQPVGQRYDPLDAAEAALAQDVVLLLLRPLHFLFATDRQGTFGHADIDVLLVHAGQLRENFDFFRRFSDIETRRCLEIRLAIPAV